MNKENAIWKRRYENLKLFMQDAELEIRNEKFEECPKRAWDVTQEVFVSFAFDVVDSEETAIELFGKDNYDVYQLKRKSLKD